MKELKVIGYWLWVIVLLSPLTTHLSPLQAQMTPEREQQFKYYFYAAQQSFDRQEYDKALMQLRLCEQLNPQDAQTKDYLGLIQYGLHNPEAARQYWAKAYELAPDQLWEHYAQSLLETKDKKQVEQGVSIIDKAARNHPKDEDTWDKLVEVLIRTGKYKQAIKAQQHLDQIKGYDEYSAITYYRIHVMAGEYKKALQAVEHYLCLEPRDTRFQLFRVQLYEQVGIKWAKLEQAYLSYLQMDPSNMTIWNNYAYGLAIHGGDLKKAEAMSLRTLKENPNSPVYLDTYAWILHLQGQDQLAQFYIRKALDNAPEGMDTKELEEHRQKICR